MKIALVSDLHLEFAPIQLPKTEADILLLAGDIVPLVCLEDNRTDAEARKIKKRVVAFMEESLSQYKQVFHIMGNHEYYHGMWEDTVDGFKELWSTHCPNVTVLNNEATDLGGLKLSAEADKPALRLWGGTLWTDFQGGNPVVMEAVRGGINDYNFINRINTFSQNYLSRYKVKLSPADTMEAHETARYALHEALRAAPDDKWIVMTHHLPSWRSITDEHKGKILNHAYASDLDLFIEAHPQITTWVHGHTHGSQDYTIGPTRILCNPRGYASSQRPNSPENDNFNPSLVFEI